MELNWIKYTSNKASNLPNKCGIYIYVRPIFDDLFEEVVYVGQTNNVYRRHNYEHLGDDETNLKLKSFLNNRSDWAIYFAEVGSNHLDGVERYIYNKCTPDFNIITPPQVNEIECNLPKSVVF